MCLFYFLYIWSGSIATRRNTNLFKNAVPDAEQLSDQDIIPGIYLLTSRLSLPFHRCQGARPRLNKSKTDLIAAIQKQSQGKR